MIDYLIEIYTLSYLRIQLMCLLICFAYVAEHGELNLCGGEALAMLGVKLTEQF